MRKRRTTLFAVVLVAALAPVRSANAQYVIRDLSDRDIRIARTAQRMGHYWAPEAYFQMEMQRTDRCYKSKQWLAKLRKDRWGGPVGVFVSTEGNLYLSDATDIRRIDGLWQRVGLWSWVVFEKLFDPDRD